MRKIHLLKTIVDFVWITSIIGYGLIFILILGVLFNADWISPKFTISDVSYSSMSISTKIIFLAFYLINGFILYCLHLFRQIIQSFKNLKIFENIVIKNFQKIGNFILFLGFFNLFFNFIFTFFIENEIVKKVSVSLSGNLFLFLGLGFFFMILSEIFKIAKNTKQENDLTI